LLLQREPQKAATIITNFIGDLTTRRNLPSS
jgi:hypothetical protein